MNSATVTVLASRHSIAAAAKKYREKHGEYVVRERARAATAKWKQRLDAKGLAKLQASARLYGALWRSRTLVFLGGHCEACGNNDSRVLQVDHRDGGGRHERRLKLNRNAKAVAQKVFAESDRYQLLCANCNFIKAFEQERPTKAYLDKVARSVV